MSRTAIYFKNISPEDLASHLLATAPYEGKTTTTGASSQWVKGYLRLGSQDFIITGPKMKVVYSGCRWNKLVFALNGAADQEVYAFEKWLDHVADAVKNIIWSNPERFKPGSKTATRFLFDKDYTKTSVDPSLYPDELKTRLSTKRQFSESGDNTYVDVIDSHLFREVDGIAEPLDAGEILSGSEVIPIIRISYYRNIERFGLTLTVLKAQVFDTDKDARPTNMDWEIDYPYK